MVYVNKFGRSVLKKLINAVNNLALRKLFPQWNQISGL